MSETRDKQRWTVIVGNVGTVYDDTNFAQAINLYNEYIRASREGGSRVTGEPVIMLCNHEVRFEYSPNEGPPTCGNQFNLYCPRCDDSKRLSVQVLVWARMTRDGTDEYGEHEWDNQSRVECLSCNWQGTANNLIEREPEL